MADETVVGLKSSSTLFALERLFATVDFSMFHQGMVAREYLVTLLAAMFTTVDE